MIYENILDTIGNTPVVRLHRIPPKNVTIYVKIESFNPMASVKDRLAFAIVTDAENRGLLRPGGRLGRLGLSSANALSVGGSGNRGVLGVALSGESLSSSEQARARAGDLKSREARDV